MDARAIDWKSGEIVYWDLNFLDPDKPITEQVFDLWEDLAVIEFPGNLVIDIGWYPARSKDGAFTIYVIKDGDWDKPLIRERCRAPQDLLIALNQAIRFVTTIDTHPE